VDAPVEVPKVTNNLVLAGIGKFKANSYTGDARVLLAVKADADISPNIVVLAAVLVVPAVKAPVAEQYQILITVAATVDTLLNLIDWT
jgi:hypothetical protein